MVVGQLIRFCEGLEHFALVFIKKGIYSQVSNNYLLWDYNFWGSQSLYLGLNAPQGQSLHKTFPLVVVLK